MTFDMTKCKIGDKLKTRAGRKALLCGISRDVAYPYLLTGDGNDLHLSDFTVNNAGKWWRRTESLSDIIGFWEEEPTEEDEQSFPNIEVRTPHIAKIITYRVHFNEMFHRDLSEEEAVAIYQQLKELLGEKNSD